MTAPAPPRVSTPPDRRPRVFPGGLAAIVATGVLATGCAVPATDTVAPPPTPSGATADLTREDLETWLDGLVPAALDQTGIPGAAVSVVHDGELLTARGYGYADTGADGSEPVPVDPQETLFRVGSVSKLFTATAVMRLVEEGRVDLDADVHEYIDFTVPTSFDEPVTLRHLLTHTPGFEERVAGMILPPDAEDDLRAHLVTDPPEQVFPPGTVPAYSNYGNALAGYVVERVSGVPFEEYVQENVLEPLGMDSSTFAQPLPDGLAQRVAEGYTVDTAAAGPFEVVAGAPAGSLTASATDMAHFMLAHLGQADRPLLEPQTLDLMHAPGLDEETLGTLAQGPRMALGFFEEDRNGRRILGHGGDTQYFHSHLQIYPDEGTGVFVALNGGGHGGIESLRLREEILFGFADRYFPAEDAPASKAEPTAVEHAAMAEGVYESSRSMYSTFLSVLGVAGGQTRVIAREDGTILVTPGPETMEPTVYEEVEPWVWREVGGQRLLAMRVAGDQVEAIGFGSAFTLLPVDTVRTASLALPVVAVSVAILLAAALSWPLGALMRRGRSLPAPQPAGRPARILARAGVACALAALAGWTVVVSLVMGFQEVPKGVLYALLGAQWAGVAAIIPAAVALVGDIRRRAGWRRCLGGLLVLSALIGVAGFAALFGLLSPDMSY
ncbi:serine hydrolase domain-containing protein [Marinactinospora thermotolerans]|uniref:CubicO group peptidase, beta-lactamase class C family n=1 Tax=Marinactinospora thermotolerans DSM 45154 TaxID=1122192 RepID=A0A1T4PDH7_9ACTN|nr:serine hydrolase domain-containing protein [Marinactinospora thermotolerans]SJZ89377.1 CubicO group peptidase, beta-lactamase class C family [Marinactinospora thermotolerans DSM 45154]